MSKDIVIAIDGDPQELDGVAVVQTAMYNGRNARWLPVDETVPRTLTVTENGEYVAYNDDCYGYYKVDVLVDGGGDAEIETDNPNGTVSVEVVSVNPAGANSSMVAHDPETGNLVYYKTDANGNITSTVVPSYPMVTTKPTKVVYQEGEAIEYAGMAITLYHEDDTVATDVAANGVIAYGSTYWNSYVTAPSGNVEDVSTGGVVVVRIKPWWYDNGTQLDEGYDLRAFFSVSIGG